MDTLEESAVSCDIIKNWSCGFRCGRQSCENEYAGRVTAIVNTRENVRKIHDLVLEKEMSAS